MNIKMQPTAVGLCATCRESQIIEDDTGATITLCHYYGHSGLLRIQRPVVRCNQYDRKGRLNSHEMEKIAWVVRTDKSGKTIGFEAPPKKVDD